jgi:hypothetical protein
VRTLLLLVVLVAACGGGKKPCPAPPARVTAQELTDLQNRICDCGDAACVEGFRPELEALNIGFYEAATLYVAIDACSTGGRAVVEELRVLRDQACGCTDVACAEKVRVEYNALLERHKSTRSSARQADQIGLLATELAGCVERVEGAAPQP